MAQAKDKPTTVQPGQAQPPAQNRQITTGQQGRQRGLARRRNRELFFPALHPAHRL